MQYDSVIEGLYGPEASILDMTNNGVLDRGDMIQYVSNGDLVTRSLGEAELYGIQQRASAVASSYLMDGRVDDGSIEFGGNMDDQQYDESYWMPIEVNGRQYWEVRDDAVPSDAILDVFDQDGGSYAFDCAAATNLILYKSRLDAIGAEDFNQIYDDLAIRGWTTLYRLDNSNWTMDYNGALDYVTGDRNTFGDGSDLLPGDYAYFTNPDVPEGGGAWQGENVIVLGNDGEGELLTYGHPVGVETGIDIGWALLSTLQGWIDPVLLALQDTVIEPFWNIF